MTIASLLDSALPSRNALQMLVRWFNSFTCMVMNGGHELYVVRGEGEHLRQRCLLCKHETKGWR